MGIRMRLTCIVALAVGCMFVSSAVAGILPPTGWGDAAVMTDPFGDQAEGSRDILAIFHKVQAGTHYFRMDIAEAPVQVAGQFAAEYFLQIDAGPGGGTAADSSYIAEGLLGIDTMIGTHYTVAGAFTSSHRHNYVGGAPPAVDTTMFGSLGGLTDFTENGGTMLQWSVPVAALPALPFTIYGVTMDISVPSTFDVTAGLVAVPEPTTLGLLLAGAVCMVAARRRRHD